MEKFFIILNLIFFLVSCNTVNGETKPLTENKFDQQSYRMNCISGDDPFKCQKQACQNANGHYNDLSKVCSCPSGSLFFSQFGGACLLADTTTENVMSFSKNKNSPFYISGSSSNLSMSHLQELTTNLSLPIFLGQSQLKIYTEVSQLAGLPEVFLQEFLNLGFPVTELDWYESNSGFKNKNMISRSVARFMFINNDQNNDALVANDKIKMVLHNLNDANYKSEIKSFSELGCAEICIEKTELLNDVESRIYRLRVFSGGNPIQDNIVLFNKIKHDTEQMLVLFNQRPSHLFVSNGAGGYEAYKYNGDKIATAQSIDKNFPEKTRRFDQEKQTPVAIFEGLYNNVADSAALFGPYLEHSYYGWFNDGDERPFYYGKTVTMLGEEEVTDPVHSAIVSRIASENLTKPILPFSLLSLINGDFEKVVPRIPFQKFAASISAAYTYTTQTCKESNLAKTIENTKNTVLWFAGAGNEARAVAKTDFTYCPQSLNSSNILIIAATSGGNSLSEVSTFGENYADIAASGCTVIEEFCDVGATSFAAPRVARAAANLMTQFPELTIEHVKLALLMTVRVPYSGKSIFIKNEFLKIKSGGILDENAARIFVTEILNHNSNLSTFKGLHFTDENRDLALNSLIAAKNQQYKDLSKNQIKKLINDHLDYLSNHYE